MNRFTQHSQIVGGLDLGRSLFDVGVAVSRATAEEIRREQAALNEQRRRRAMDEASELWTEGRVRRPNVRPNLLAE